MKYTIYKGNNPPIQFDNDVDYRNYVNSENIRLLNEKEYAKQHKSDKIHYIFHGGCHGCITPLNFEIGNCLGCFYFECDKSKPILKIEDFSK